MASIGGTVAKPWRRGLLLGFVLALQWGCSRAPESAHVPVYGDTPVIHAAPGSEWLLGVRLTRRPERFFEIYQPLVDDLNRDLAGARFRLDLSRSNAVFADKLRHGRLQLAIANPYPAVRALGHGYRIVARIGAADATRGVIVVRRDSGLRDLSDLKGTAMSLRDRNSLGGVMLVRWMLREHGIELARDLTVRGVGSGESALLSVYYGRTPSGASTLSDWRAFQRTHRDSAERMEARWQTSGLPGNALLLQDSLPAHVVRHVRNWLLGLNRGPAGRALLARLDTDRVDLADANSYASVRNFIRRYEAAFGSVEGEQ
ncbi:MAG: phosphate/phosphite/phosphonate ABC transporter substrate-binding protein [Betaproteobacteria bacterium]|nr:phosphate/phosphite/phosphonate ABC transporter substrate-binding protein [Betaproteobacteria bacterium]